MAAADWKKEQEDQSPYEAALAAALDDLAQARRNADVAQKELHSAEARAAELTQIIRDLAAILPPHRVTLFKQRLGSLHLAPPPSTRAGPVHDNVIHLFAKGKRREWSASEIQAALAEQGKQADPKAVYNVLNYLVRRGSLRRFGRGQYFVVDLGLGIQLGQDLDGTDRNGGGCMED